MLKTPPAHGSAYVQQMLPQTSTQAKKPCALQRETTSNENGSMREPLQNGWGLQNKQQSFCKDLNIWVVEVVQRRYIVIYGNMYWKHLQTILKINYFKRILNDMNHGWPWLISSQQGMVLSLRSSGCCVILHIAHALDQQPLGHHEQGSQAKLGHSAPNRTVESLSPVSATDTSVVMWKPNNSFFTKWWFFSRGVPEWLPNIPTTKCLLWPLQNGFGLYPPVICLCIQWI